MGLGISLVTIADLGTTAISSLPYVLSNTYQLSFGTFMALLNITFVFIEILLLKKAFPKEQYLQFFVGPLLGLSIDLCMYLFSFLQPSSYIWQVIMVFFGSVIIAFGTVLQLAANVVNNSAEGLVKVLAIKAKKEFGIVKLFFDVSLVVAAVVISLFAMGRIIGIREGTIISALIVGPMMRLIRKVLGNFINSISRKKVFPE